jgi:hypothetical protein
MCRGRPGTEFALSVGADRSVEVHVNRGEVRIDLPGGASRSVVAHEAARLEEHGKALVTGTFDAARFAEGPVTLSLADVLAGGDGLGEGANVGIDPATGRIARAFAQERPAGVDAAAYHRVPGNRFIDGVFIPGRRGSEAVIDSTGRRFAGFPKTDGRHLGPIWAARPRPGDPVEGDLSAKDSDNWLAGLYLAWRYSLKEQGLLAIHSNAAITFDVAALAEAHGKRPTELSMTAANAAPEAARSKACELWVIVDGVALQRTKLVAGASQPIRLDLPRQARFVTLASTDAGDQWNYDWLVLGDAVVRLEN